jgi:hypothetical protein
MWESVLSTVAGGAVAAGAGVLTALMQGRQASMLRAEQQRREDRYRLHRDRVDAYLAFHTAASEARRVLQNLTDGTPEDDRERRAARNATHLAYVKIALIGGAEVVAAARRMMIHIDGIAYGRAAFEVDAWNDVLDPFQEAARYNLTGQHDLAPIIVDPPWPSPPAHPPSRT